MCLKCLQQIPPSLWVDSLNVCGFYLVAVLLFFRETNEQNIKKGGKKSNGSKIQSDGGG